MPSDDGRSFASNSRPIGEQSTAVVAVSERVFGDCCDQLLDGNEMATREQTDKQTTVNKVRRGSWPALWVDVTKARSAAAIMRCTGYAVDRAVRQCTYSGIRTV
jgi:hypothetical protein